MDTRLNYVDIIKKILKNYADLYAQAGLPPMRTLFDDSQQSYMLLDIGWYGKKYIHNAIIHMEIIDDKIWIQNDDTETGVANDLIKAGVPQEDIVLGFHPPKVRPYTEFAVA